MWDDAALCNYNMAVCLKQDINKYIYSVFSRSNSCHIICNEMAFRVSRSFPASCHCFILLIFFLVPLRSMSQEPSVIKTSPSCTYLSFPLDYINCLTAKSDLGFSVFNCGLQEIFTSYSRFIKMPLRCLETNNQKTQQQNNTIFQG